MKGNGPGDEFIWRRVRDDEMHLAAAVTDPEAKRLHLDRAIAAEGSVHLASAKPYEGLEDDYTGNRGDVATQMLRILDQGSAP